MIFLDANVFMYAAGSEHPHKEPCAALIRAIASGEREGVTSAEVLQEILHRYRAINRWEQGRLVYDDARRLVDAVLPITADATDRARALLDDHPALSARDALHAATCIGAGIDTICTYDRGFDGIAGLKRTTP